MPLNVSALNHRSGGLPFDVTVLPFVVRVLAVSEVFLFCSSQGMGC